MKTISIIGGGWRTECWIKVIQLLKDAYTLSTVYCRNKEKSERLEKLYGIKTNWDYKNVYNENCDIVIVCVQRNLNEELSNELASNGINVLCETPFLLSESITAKDKIRVAEQYMLQPRFAALKNVIESGIIGKVHTVKLSCCHDYHAVSVMRNLIGVGNEYPEKIEKITLTDTYEDMFFRFGRIPSEIKEHKRNIAYLRYGKKTAIYDFSEGQYFSPIRRHQIEISGEKGQIIDEKVTYIENGEVFETEIVSNYNGTKGDLFPLSLGKITCNGKVVYTNKYEYIGLSEEQIAMADCLKENLLYFEEGHGGYSCDEANTDYLIGKKVSW